MSDSNNVKIPKEAIQTLKIVEELLDKMAMNIQGTVSFGRRIP